jgi:hypothetical protein
VRTTLTLDDDVAVLLRRLVERRREPAKKIVNEAMRAGLAALAETPRSSRRRYRVRPVSLGRPRLPNVDNVAEVLAVAEGERHA